MHQAGAGDLNDRGVSFTTSARPIAYKHGSYALRAEAQKQRFGAIGSTVPAPVGANLLARRT
jgi:hypothetical protein